MAWLMQPHVSKAIKPKDIYDHEKLIAESEMTKEQEFESFDTLFMNSEEKKKSTSKKITEALKRNNAKKKKDKENGN